MFVWTIGDLVAAFFFVLFLGIGLIIAVSVVARRVWGSCREFLIRVRRNGG